MNTKIILSATAAIAMTLCACGSDQSDRPLTVIDIESLVDAADNYEGRLEMLIHPEVTDSTMLGISNIAGTVGNLNCSYRTKVSLSPSTQRAAVASALSTAAEAAPANTTAPYNPIQALTATAGKCLISSATNFFAMTCTGIISEQSTPWA